ncbi:uncharacterized protein LOC106012332 [Aplysia californica]|uniref:Uncharacterized protein LOC106012332 n=1 Tax=Aplysia californica TaxID=6500 RepID=A0ABM1A440_APLCA|nr:uncharacterized protein LOC106012332 [Aplysia californica]
MGCRTISSRLITIRLRAVPFNITIIQAYAPTSDYDEQAVKGSYDLIQEVIDQTPKKYIIVVQDDWNAKVEKDACKNWKGTCGQYCNSESNERGLRLLEFASYNNLVLTNTFSQHTASRRWTWHSPSGEHHNQIDYIMVKKRFQSSSVKIGKTRTFPGADVGSDHDLVMMTFHLLLNRVKKQGNTRMKFDVEKLKDPEVAAAFQAMIGGKCAPLTVIDAGNNNDTDMDTWINTFNTAVTETTSQILGKHRRVNKPRITTDVLNLCDKRRKLKEKKKQPDGAKEYRANYRTISLISQPSKFMLKRMLNRFKPQAEKIFAEEQAGFRAGRSTKEQIFNLRILSTGNRFVIFSLYFLNQKARYVSRTAIAHLLTEILTAPRFFTLHMKHGSCIMYKLAIPFTMMDHA